MFLLFFSILAFASQEKQASFQKIENSGKVAIVSTTDEELEIGYPFPMPSPKPKPPTKPPIY